MGAGTTGEEKAKPRRRAALTVALALVALVALQDTAMAAGTTSGFEVRRVQSLPLNAPAPLNMLVNEVASPLNYGGVSSNGVFFRPVNGTNEDSPLAFAGLQISVDFGGDSPPTQTTLHLTGSVLARWRLRSTTAR